MYAAVADGRPLNFEVGGYWRRNMMMRDRETGTIWQQATGEGVVGPLGGRRLEALGGEISTWAGWRAEHPRTTLALEPARAPKGLASRVPFEAAVAFFARIRFAPPGRHPRDPRLHPKEEVAGVVLDGEARAYPLSLLRQQRVVNDRVGGTPIAVVCDIDTDRVRAFDRRADGTEATLVLEDGLLADAGHARRWTLRGEPVAGQQGEGLHPIPITRQWWLAWSEFHPGTSVYLGT